MGSTLARLGSRERSPQRGAVRVGAPCTPGFDVATNPATLQALMRGADAGTRERLATALQRRHGNAAVQRLLAPAVALPLQRWTVGLPRATTDCAQVVSHLDANSPHSPAWAKTSIVFHRSPEPVPVYTESEGVITATVSNPTVTMTAPISVDMPEWSPTDPAMSQAWGAMYAELRVHEARHEAIAAEWEATLNSRLSGLSVTVANRDVATFRAAVQAKWETWIAEHQKAQNAIDPFYATLDCSGGESEDESEESTGVEGDVAATGEE
jgi:predicted secreted Zn-dependent protease